MTTNDTYLKRKETPMLNNSTFLYVWSADFRRYRNQYPTSGVTMHRKFIPEMQAAYRDLRKAGCDAALARMTLVHTVQFAHSSLRRIERENKATS